ncbi:hypothetical protein RP726_05535 [Candidatus Methylospira mobilis]|uniref:hypothetical protein n=1 Tax=Candidatus Methylospira mobilis TaxID=1808979 RepID=UPI0028E7FBD3|nr:hypothetical protein [Candidatus Methylospira mobilis]WNV05874.1 hypothetical protein RP726_05535 [Candidatus Methylospira mobilis]
MKLWMMVLMMFTAIAEAAGPQWYQDVYGTANYNGQITLHDANGNTVTVASNPTGANVLSTQSSSVQPPVVIVQATATMPIHAVGDPCTASTTGTSPNQLDAEFIAITLDRTQILTCQNSRWVAQGSSHAIATALGLNTAMWPDHFYGCGNGNLSEIFTLVATNVGPPIYQGFAGTNDFIEFNTNGTFLASSFSACTHSIQWYTSNGYVF